MSSKANEAILKSLALAEKALGRKIDIPIETIDDQVREAQAVLKYFEDKGADFYEQDCKHCGRTYAYKWRYRGVAYCSLQCMKDALEDIGLEWSPGKLPHERWGQTIPVVVPPEALALLKSLSPEVPGPTGEPEEPSDEIDFDEFLKS